MKYPRYDTGIPDDVWLENYQRHLKQLPPKPKFDIRRDPTDNRVPNDTFLDCRINEIYSKIASIRNIAKLTESLGDQHTSTIAIEISQYYLTQLAHGLSQLHYDLCLDAKGSNVEGDSIPDEAES